MPETYSQHSPSDIVPELVGSTSTKIYQRPTSKIATLSKLWPRNHGRTPLSPPVVPSKASVTSSFIMGSSGMFVLGIEGRICSAASVRRLVLTSRTRGSLPKQPWAMSNLLHRFPHGKGKCRLQMKGSQSWGPLNARGFRAVAVPVEATFDFRRALGKSPLKIRNQKPEDYLA